MMMNTASPDVISSTEGLAVADEARAVLVEEDAALDALEARGVPLEVGRHAQDVLVLDGRAAADAQAPGDAAAHRRPHSAADRGAASDAADGSSSARHRRVMLMRLHRVVVQVVMVLPSSYY